MHPWIALFRGINVGGNNLLPMAKLKSDFESLKFTHVCTYIQSGNVVFNSTAKTRESIARAINRRIKEQHGFGPHVLLLTSQELFDAMNSNPFPEATANPKSLHFFFLAEQAKNADLAAMEHARASSEKFRLTKNVFYLFAPDGIARSKLAANVEKYLRVVATARNYRTVERVWSMATNRNA